MRTTSDPQPGKGGGHLFSRQKQSALRNTPKGAFPVGRRFTIVDETERPEMIGSSLVVKSRLRNGAVLQFVDPCGLDVSETLFIGFPTTWEATLVLDGNRVTYQRDDGDRMTLEAVD